MSRIEIRVMIMVIMVMIITNLNNFDRHEQREWQGGHDQENRDHGHQVGADARAFVAH